MRLLTKLAILGWGMCASGFATALPTVFTYQGTCDFNCDLLGLADGGAVGGTLTAAEGFDLDDVLSASELLDFDLDFGTLSVTPATHSATGGIALGDAFADDLRFSDGIFGIGLTAVNTGHASSLEGWLARVGFNVLNINNYAGGSGSYTSTSVPEPDALTLMGLGLLALGLGRLRRRA